MTAAVLALCALLGPLGQQPAAAEKLAAMQEPAAVEAPAALVGLRIDPAPARTDLSIVLDGEVPVHVSEPLVLGDRARIEIELPGAAVRVIRPIFAGPPLGGILALRAVPGPGGARVVIDLPANRRYDVRAATGGLLLAVENHGAPAPLWITGVRGRGSPPRIVPAAAPDLAPAPSGRVAASAPRPAPAEQVATPAPAMALAGPAAAPAAAQAATAGASPAGPAYVGAASQPAPGAAAPRAAARRAAPAPAPAYRFSPPTPMQAAVLLGLLALPSVLLALLRRRGRTAAPAGQGEASNARAPRRHRAPRAPRRDARDAGGLWAARTLARTDAPALEVARRTGLSQDAVRLLRRGAGAVRAEEAAAAGRNVRPLGPPPAPALMAPIRDK